MPGPTTTGLPAIGIRLVDETNFLTVTVPADWTDQNLANSRHDDGSERATITAAPDIQQYFETWEGSGTHLLALPPTTDPAVVLNQFAYPGACTDEGITLYSDSRFTGQRQDWSNCDGLATRVVNVAARPLDASFTLFIQVQQATPDDAALNQILASAGPVQGAAYPTPVASAPLTPTGPVPPELLAAPATPLTTVTDEQGRLSISVPSAWSDTDVGPHLNDDATDRPRALLRHRSSTISTRTGRRQASRSSPIRSPAIRRRCCATSGSPINATTQVCSRTTTARSLA